MKHRSMKLRFLTFAALSLAAVIGLGLIATQTAQAQNFKVLYNFTGGSDGEGPIGQPVVDNHGNIFGTAEQGGSSHYGTVWEYSFDGTFSVLHSFVGSDGIYPSAGVKLDGKGKMFGTTVYGGSAGGGTVFEITPSGNFATLYDFGSQNNDPAVIYSGVTLDASGDLYGTSYQGGSSQSCYPFGCGTVWKLSSSGLETVLHSFDFSDGAWPGGGDLKMDEQGNLYGVTSGGDSNADGTLFEISSGGAFSVLYNFTGGRDGCGPVGSLLNYKGNLNGTAVSSCGSGGYGTVWQYNLGGKTLKLLHSFSGTDGAHPFGGVGCQQGKKAVCAGNMFGTTNQGGIDGNGTVWEIDSSGKFRTLHKFANSDGTHPSDRLFVDNKGNIYGTTVSGGSYGDGTLWEITAAKKAKQRQPVNPSTVWDWVGSFPRAASRVSNTGLPFLDSLSEGQAVMPALCLSTC
jgi:uncharacterized repeat protein (TIGR03803 family)